MSAVQKAQQTSTSTQQNVKETNVTNDEMTKKLMVLLADVTDEWNSTPNVYRRGVITGVKRAVCAARNITQEQLNDEIKKQREAQKS